MPWFCQQFQVIPWSLFVWDLYLMDLNMDHEVLIFQTVYNRTFLRSRLQIQSGMGIATGNVINFLTPATCGEAINLFLLPEIGDTGVIPLFEISMRKPMCKESSNVKPDCCFRRGWSLQRSSWVHWATFEIAEPDPWSHTPSHHTQYTLWEELVCSMALDGVNWPISYLMTSTEKLI